MFENMDLKLEADLLFGFTYIEDNYDRNAKNAAAASKNYDFVMYVKCRIQGSAGTEDFTVHVLRNGNSDCSWRGDKPGKPLYTCHCE